MGKLDLEAHGRDLVLLTPRAAPAQAPLSSETADDLDHSRRRSCTTARCIAPSATST